MVNDHLSDLVTRVRNGYLAKLAKISVPKTKAVAKVLEVLADEGYVASVKEAGRELEVELKYDGKTPALAGISRVSKPGVRVYAGIKDLPKVCGGLGMNILSTPKGILGEKKARKLKVGGEVIAQVW